jgi:hypothetical protein
VPVARLRALVHSVRLEHRTRLARRGEMDALARAGVRLASASDVPAGLAPETLAAIRRLGGRIDALTQDMVSTHAADRADYLAVAPWMRPIVVIRGLAARQVLRHQRAACRRELGPHHLALGAAALALSADERARLGVTEALGAATRAKEQQTAAGVGRRGVLAPLGGAPLPDWTARAGAEAGTLARAVGKQLQGQLFPRASALAGMAAGWWVANTYTDSHVRSVLRSVGIGSGGTRVVSADTYRAMSFWLPILAAAVCAYLGNRLAGYIGRRYAGAEARMPVES